MTGHGLGIVQVGSLSVGGRQAEDEGRETRKPAPGMERAFLFQGEGRRADWSTFRRSGSGSLSRMRRAKEGIRFHVNGNSSGVSGRLHALKECRDLAAQIVRVAGQVLGGTQHL